MTTKLFWNDSHLSRFDAQVVEAVEINARQAVILDQTAFYPEGGGQPCDTGTLNEVPVVEVQVGDNERILHFLANGSTLAVGTNVVGEINWLRRREMMQQHTGQHIISQAFFQLYGAETRGFRINDRLTEIDLTLELQPEEIEQAIVRAEELANGIIFDNREIRVHEVTPAEAAKLPLRKESFITDCIRVIEIDDFDWSPCGGTHAKRTGEVGLIAVRRWERAKKMTRLHFVCGSRALDDYRLANKSAEAAALKLTVGREEIEASVVRLLDDNKRLSRRVRELSELAANIEAAELLAASAFLGKMRIVEKVFTDRDFDEAKLIAHRLVDEENVVALLAVREADMARLVFARSANLTADMNALMKVACEKLGGRGGGKPDFAQGGGNQIEELQAAIKAALVMAAV
ncbi:MAG: DHHA1 domain-containing protein [Acidobacteriota bacterium]|nr:DHHA1 domain-containing protein [Acidobacteriota bacterium]